MPQQSAEGYSRTKNKRQTNQQDAGLGLPPFHFPNPGWGSGDEAPSRRGSESITPKKLLELYMLFRTF